MDQCVGPQFGKDGIVFLNEHCLYQQILIKNINISKRLFTLDLKMEKSF